MILWTCLKVGSNLDAPDVKGAIVAQDHGDGSQRSYERYLALDRAEALSGNVIGAENYYQHAEHYFRLMSSDRGAT